MASLRRLANDGMLRLYFGYLVEPDQSLTSTVTHAIPRCLIRTNCEQTPRRVFRNPQRPDQRKRLRERERIAAIAGGAERLSVKYNVSFHYGEAWALFFYGNTIKAAQIVFSNVEQPRHFLGGVTQRINMKLQH